MLRPPIEPNHSPYLALPNWVEAHLHDLTILDGTFTPPNTDMDATQIYLGCHLPGALRFDIDIVKDSASPLPHMLPGPQEMSRHLQQLGLEEGQTIVIYDQQGLFGAARVWWMMRVYGFENCFILEGGLPRWLDENRPVESGHIQRPATDITVNLEKKFVSRKSDVQRALDEKMQVVDARPAVRFIGQIPEPRPGLRTGHMPGAVNLPYSELVADRSLKNLDELRAIFDKYGIDPERPVISSCGSGVSAALLCLALASLGKTHWSLYDGSWAEWGACSDCKVVKAA